MTELNFVERIGLEVLRQRIDGQSPIFTSGQMPSWRRSSSTEGVTSSADSEIADLKNT
jgi:hypothetical protein